MKYLGKIIDDKDLVTKEYVDAGLNTKVDSVNGDTGIVVLTTDDVSATDNNRYVPSVPVTNAEVSYLNGNGQFVPIAVGGASSIANMFLSNTTSAIIGTYKTLHYTSPDVGVTEMSVNVTNSADVLSAVYLYNAPIGVDIIDGGVWESTFYMKSSSRVGINRLKIVCFMRAVDGTETELFTKYTNSVNDTNYAYYYSETTRNYFNVDPTSYLGFKIYGNTNRTSTVTIYYSLGGEKASYINSPLALRHNQVRDLNEDSNYQHITSTQVEKLNGIESGAQVNTVTGVKGNAESAYRIGNINITPANIGLGNVNNTSDVNKPVSTAQQNALNLKAPLASPSLTGTPTAPTATTGDNSTKIATTEFVQNTVSAVSGGVASFNGRSGVVLPQSGDYTATMVGAQPTITGAATTITDSNLSGSMALISNTDGKVAESNVTSTELLYLSGIQSNVQQQINYKAPLYSPPLVGTPTAPTAASGTSTTQIATTQFVQNALSSAGTGTTVNIVRW